MPVACCTRGCVGVRLASSGGVGGVGARDDEPAVHVADVDARRRGGGGTRERVAQAAEQARRPRLGLGREQQHAERVGRVRDVHRAGRLLSGSKGPTVRRAVGYGCGTTPSGDDASKRAVALGSATKPSALSTLSTRSVRCDGTRSSAANSGRLPTARAARERAADDRARARALHQRAPRRPHARIAKLRDQHDAVVTVERRQRRGARRVAGAAARVVGAAARVVGRARRERRACRELEPSTRVECVGIAGTFRKVLYRLNVKLSSIAAIAIQFSRSPGFLSSF